MEALSPIPGKQVAPDLLKQLQAQAKQPSAVSQDPLMALLAMAFRPATLGAGAIKTGQHWYDLIDKGRQGQMPSPTDLLRILGTVASTASNVGPVSKTPFGKR